MRHARAALPFALAFAMLTGCAPDAVAPLDPASAPSLARAGATTQRSIEEWVARQDDYCADPANAGGPACPNLFPGMDVVGFFDPVSGLCAGVDYPAIADRYLRQTSGGATSLGTTFSGHVTERVLRDGRAEISVVLRTDNALAFAQPCADFPSTALAFGDYPTAILAGATPAVGWSFFQLTYIAPAPGLPFPSLIQVLFAEAQNYELVKYSFHAQAEGPLHASSGYPEGTMGRLWIQQVGRPTPGLLKDRPSSDYPGDYWPVETITLRPIGRAN